MKKRLQGLITGLLIGITVTSGFVFATSGSRSIEVLYNNIKVYKDNVLCELKDTNGTVIEPFIYNGTTYMPVRGTANLADMEVTWDGAKQSVYLWDDLHPSGSAFLESCQPYDERGCRIYLASKGESFSMSGEKYSNGLTFEYNSSYALFNINSKYSSIECTVGNTDSHQYNKIVSFIVDGRVIKEVELEAECLPKTVSIPLNYGLQLKILGNGEESYYENDFGVGNITIK